MEAEDRLTPLGVMFILVAFLIAIFFVFLPDFAKAREHGIGAAALCALVGLGLLTVRRWQKRKDT